MQSTQVASWSGLLRPARTHRPRPRRPTSQTTGKVRSIGGPAVAREVERGVQTPTTGERYVNLRETLAQNSCRA